MPRARHVVIGGGSGFIGSALAAALRARGDRVTLISRYSGPGRITWDDLSREGLPTCDAVVNLAGRHILDLRRRWTDAYREEVVRSRVDTTERLVAGMNASAAPPEVFVSVAGKCFYGTRELAAGEAYPELDEDSAPMGLDFPAELVRLWEAAAEGVDSARIRHVRLRIGIVLAGPTPGGRRWQVDRSRGILPIVAVPFRLGAGGAIGTGAQPFPWVHIDDMVGILLHVINRSGTSGRYNAVAPGIVTHRDFVEAVARQLRRRVPWTVPAWLVRAVVGTERSSILLEGQLIRPRRTLESGYVFRHPELEPALAQLLAGAAPRAGPGPEVTCRAEPMLGSCRGRAGHPWTTSP
jgi:uncharacterized protein (TIGR01777 family)